MKLHDVRLSVRVSVRLSVSVRAHSSKPVPTSLLLWARRAGDVDRLLQHLYAAGECGQCHIVSVRIGS